MIRKRIVATLMILGGCVPVKVPPRPVATPESAPPRVERPAVEPLPGLIVTEIEPKKEPERLYTFSLRDADIREVLMALSKQTTFNIVVDPDVQGRVTVDLRNVSLTEALDTLTELLDLSYRVKQNVIRVSKPFPETRIFSLQYFNLKRTGTSATSAQIGAGLQTAPGGAVGGAAAGQLTVATGTETDLWKDIEAGVGRLLSPVGKMVVDKQSANILVTDLPKFLDRIAGFLESVEGSVQRQVIIDAKIVEVTLTDEYKFGLDWAAIFRAIGKGFLAAAEARVTKGLLEAQGLGEFAMTPQQAFQIGTLRALNIDTVLEAMSKQGALNILSSPRVSTLNNQPAVIKAGTDEVFFDTRVTAGTLTTPETRTFTPRTVTVGVVLGVTPQIGPDGTIAMHVHPIVTEKQGTAKSPLGDTFPILNVRETNTVVRVKEGQVLVIAGLIQEKRASDQTGMPFLGSIPGIGFLFRQDTKEKRKTELVILLTPTVLVGKKINEIAGRDLERLRKTKEIPPSRP